MVQPAPLAPAPIAAPKPVAKAPKLAQRTVTVQKSAPAPQQVVTITFGD